MFYIIKSDVKNDRYISSHNCLNFCRIYFSKILIIMIMLIVDTIHVELLLENFLVSQIQM